MWSSEKALEQLKKVRIIRGKRIYNYELTSNGLPNSKVLRNLFEKRTMGEVWDIVENELSPGIREYLGIGDIPRFTC